MIIIMSQKILEVNHLKISFRTPSGTLKAVRDISFDLCKGETLAIVGESGSGKSVTSKAILGILSGNSIVEGGEILYDAKDLLKIDEEDMHKIRGDKIAMIFQDPLSSLNPIVKIGKQITEAMLLKNKASRKASRKEFNAILAVLKANMNEVLGADTQSEVNELIEMFDKFNIEAIRYETAYNEAQTHAQELIADIDDLLFLIEKKQSINMKDKLGRICGLIPRVRNGFLTKGRDAELNTLISSVSAAGKSYMSQDAAATREIVRVLTDTRTFMAELVEQTRPNFFRIGYYSLKNPGMDLAWNSIDELNEIALKYLDTHFMQRFIELEQAGIAHSYAKSIAAKKAALVELPGVRAYFAAGGFTKKEAADRIKQISALVTACIDPLEVIKDSTTYTFPSALENAVDKYFKAVMNNPREEARYAKQTAKREALIARGKTVNWKVVPKAVYDLDELSENIVAIIDRLMAKYERDISMSDSVDMHAKAIELVDFLKEKASQAVYKLTKRMAKEKAIKLMDEVGIPESRIRYNQYPFEFSGGMRQRIVIAIALSSNPDILICDEPTTALDVTVQAQVLRLLRHINRKHGMSIIFISHDLSVVRQICDRVAVMYAGRIVETASAKEIMTNPQHEYTKGLIRSIPTLQAKGDDLPCIPGRVPSTEEEKDPCPFAPRCTKAQEICKREVPPCKEAGEGHQVYCHFV